MFTAIFIPLALATASLGVFLWGLILGWWG
jgi:hypothetical protein